MTSDRKGTVSARMRRKRFFMRRKCGDIDAIHPTTGSIIRVNYQRDALIRDLDEDLRRLPGTLSWYVQLRDTAKAAYKEAMYREHCVEEDLSVKIREEDDTLKETEIKMRVRTSLQMRAAYRARMDAETMLRNLESAVQTIVEKKWALKAMVDLRRVEITDDHA